MPAARRSSSLWCLATAFCAVFCQVHCLSRDQLFPFGSELDNSLVQDNDISSTEMQLTTPITFYGTEYSTLYVNDNGLVSFLTEVPIFFNAQFPLHYPIIAPFYSDVDTRATGRVFYRETQDDVQLKRFEALVADNFAAGSHFRARSLFIATWDAVGYFDRKSDKVNTFQVVVGSEEGESYVAVLYPENGLQWIQADSKSPSLPDAKAQAGFMSGDGSALTVIRGSGTDHVVNLDKMSNSGVRGQWLFRVSGSQVLGPDVVSEDVVESGTSCATAQEPCPPYTSCADYETGFCCQCDAGFFGNGRLCIANGTAQRITGKLSGLLNDVPVGPDLDFHSYVVTQDGRSYTSLSRVDSTSLGTDLQSLLALGGVVGWMFAVPAGHGAFNGFTLTGGVFNRTAEVTFPQTGHHVTIREQYRGINAFGVMRMSVEVRGTLPSLLEGSKVMLQDYTEDYHRVAPGLVRSHLSLSFKTEGSSSLSIPFVLNQNIAFEQCPHGPEAHSETQRLNVARNFIAFDPTDRVVRYAHTATISPVSVLGSDPCQSADCGEHSSCVPDGAGYRCQCDKGYEPLREPEACTTCAVVRVACVDIDECVSGRDDCHAFAECVNLDGGFACRCRPGFTGDGLRCEKSGEPTCAELGCHPLAECVQPTATHSRHCRCKPGYHGDGINCVTSGSFGTSDCRLAPHLCDPNALCQFDHPTGTYACRCRPEYQGDGFFCARRSCREIDSCHPEAQCTYDRYGDYRCVCNEGFEGDGYDCRRQDTSACADLRCHPAAECVPAEAGIPRHCRCRPGFAGDGVTCVPTSTDCRLAPHLCDVNADCEYDFRSRSYSCRCRRGWRGDGAFCAKESCVDADNCHPDARCLYDKNLDDYYCACIPGFAGDGYDCRPEVSDTHLSGQQQRESCHLANDCHPRAQCVYNATLSRHHCRCLLGYVGDGYQCTLGQEAGCDIVNTCSPTGGECVRDSQGRYVCRCREGFEGDGRHCEPFDECSSIEQCHPHAQCLYDGRRYRCQCNRGYRGDGQLCEPLPDAPCDLVNTCGPRAQCLYDATLQTHRCVCEPGTEGDGYACRPVRLPPGKLTCAQDPGMCGPNAACVPLESDGVAHVCQCLPGFTGDGSYCMAVPKVEGGYLLFGQGMSILQMPLNPTKGNPGNLLLMEQQQTVVGIAVDCTEGRIYWTDAASGLIRRAWYNGSSPETFQSGLRSPEGLAVDWASRNIFWTDSVADTIEVASLVADYHSVLIDTGLVNPRGIAVHVTLGRMYWSDWHRALPRIESAYMDGTGRQVLVEGNGLELPNMLALDLEHNDLCWTDAGRRTVECINLSGSGRRTVFTPAEYPFGLAIAGGQVFWTDWNIPFIHRVDRNGGNADPLPLPLGGNGKLYGIAAVPPYCPPLANACSHQNGGCRHLCLPSGQWGRTCHCGGNDTFCNEVNA